MNIGRNTSAADKLTSLADRIERLLDDIDALREDLKTVKLEAKGEGFNVRALTRLVAIRRSKRSADAEAALLNDLLLYAHATGTPLDLTSPTASETPGRADPGRTEAPTV